MNTLLLDVENMPFVLASDLHLLPRIVAVYFAWDASGELLYVGKAVNLYHRWRNHHKADRLHEHGFAKLSWKASDLACYSEIESQCIGAYKPILNGRRKDGKAYAVPERTMTDEELDESLERIYPLFSRYYA